MKSIQPILISKRIWISDNEQYHKLGANMQEAQS